MTEFKRRGVSVATLVQIARLGHAWSGGAAGEQFSDSKGGRTHRAWSGDSQPIDLARSWLSRQYSRIAAVHQ